MKQQIAGFLGELAEELVWAPELAHARVRPEMSQPATPRQPAVLSADPRDPNSLSTPVDRMLRELEQLRATVKHLGSEVIHLRAQMAHLRRLPSPPDAGETDVAEAVGGRVAVAAAPHIEPPQADRDAVSTDAVSTTDATEPETRPRRPQLVTTPAAETASAVSVHQPVSERSPAVEAPPASLANESVNHSEVVESTVDSAPDDTGPAAGLELFASEPSSNGDDQPDEALSAAGTGGSAGAKGHVKSRRRRRHRHLT